MWKCAAEHKLVDIFYFVYDRTCCGCRTDRCLVLEVFGDKLFLPSCFVVEPETSRVNVEAV